MKAEATRWLQDPSQKGEYTITYELEADDLPSGTIRSSGVNQYILVWRSFQWCPGYREESGCTLHRDFCTVILKEQLKSDEVRQTLFGPRTAEHGLFETHYLVPAELFLHDDGLTRQLGFNHEIWRKYARLGLTGPQYLHGAPCLLAWKKDHQAEDWPISLWSQL